MLDEIKEFFRVYKNLEGKKVVIKGFESLDLAIPLIENAIEDYKQKFLATWWFQVPSEHHRNRGNDFRDTIGRLGL